MENVFNYSNIRFVWNPKLFMKYSSRPTFKNGKVINDNLWLVDNKYEDVLVNKPLYIGPIIIDIAKRLMFDFHYNHLLKEINPNNVKLLFTDTDSLVYEFSNVDIKHHYNNLINNNLLDTSTYKFNNELLFIKLL